MFERKDQPKRIVPPQIPGANASLDSQDLGSPQPAQTLSESEPVIVDTPIIQTVRHSASVNRPWYQAAAQKAVGAPGAMFQYFVEEDPQPVGESLKDIVRIVVAVISFVGTNSGKGMMKITSIAFTGAGKTLTGLGNIVERGAEGAESLDNRLNKIPSIIIGTAVTGGLFTGLGYMAVRYFNPDLTNLTPLKKPVIKIMPSTQPTASPVVPLESPTKLPAPSSKSKPEADGVIQY